MSFKRPSIIFAISAIAGVLLAYNKILTIDKIIILSIVFILLILLIYKKYFKIYILYASIIIALLFGLRYKMIDIHFNNINKIIEDDIKKDTKLIGKVSSTGRSTNSYYIDLANTSFEDGSKNIGNIRCYYNPLEVDGDYKNIKIGEKILISGKAFTFEKARNIGQFDSENYYRSLGLSASYYARSIDIIDSHYNKFLQTIDDLKVIVKEKIESIFTKDNAGIFICMITGDKSGISNDKKKMYQENGIAHILAISGLHLSILGLALFEFLRRKLKLSHAALIVSIFILLYGIFINSGVTSLRAIIMLYIRFLSLAMKRSYDSQNTLCMLLITFLLINPYNLFNVGFQFSYLAIFSLNCDFKINSDLKVPSVIVLTLLLLPITVYNYFTYPLYSIILNLIVIPLMTFVLLFGLLGLFISFFSVTLAKFTVGIVHVIFLLYEKLCNIIDALPYHRLIFGKPSLKSIILFYIILFLIYFIYKTMIRNNKIKILKYKVLVPVCSVLLLFASIFLMTYKPHNIFKITSLSVGQGDGFVIDDFGKIITIDGGSSSNTSVGEYIMSTYFLANKITEINKAYISHIDADHMNGIEYLLTNDRDIKIDEVILPITAKENQKYNVFKALLNRYKIKYSYLERGDVDYIDESLSFDCLSPSNNKSNKLSNDINQSSLVLKLNYKDKSMLFTGDIEKEMEKEILLDKRTKDKLKCDILKVAHHGSKSSSLIDFIWKADPKYAIISYGYKNTYGHPHAKTIDTLNNEKIKIYDTVQGGMIDIYLSEKVDIKPYFSGK